MKSSKSAVVFELPSFSMCNIKNLLSFSDHFEDKDSLSKGSNSTVIFWMVILIKFYLVDWSFLDVLINAEDPLVASWGLLSESDLNLIIDLELEWLCGEGFNLNWIIEVKLKCGWEWNSNQESKSY